MTGRRDMSGKSLEIRRDRLIRYRVDQFVSHAVAGADICPFGFLGLVLLAGVTGTELPIGFLLASDGFWRALHNGVVLAALADVAFFPVFTLPLAFMPFHGLVAEAAKFGRGRKEAVAKLVL